MYHTSPTLTPIVCKRQWREEFWANQKRRFAERKVARETLKREKSKEWNAVKHDLKLAAKWLDDNKKRTIRLHANQMEDLGLPSPESIPPPTKNQEKKGKRAQQSLPLNPPSTQESDNKTLAELGDQPITENETAIEADVTAKVVTAHTEDAPVVTTPAVKRRPKRGVQKAPRIRITTSGLGEKSDNSSGNQDTVSEATGNQANEDAEAAEDSDEEDISAEVWESKKRTIRQKASDSSKKPRQRYKTTSAMSIAGAVDTQFRILKANARKRTKDTKERRLPVLEKIGSGARVTLTSEDIKERKYAIRCEKADAKVNRQETRTKFDDALKTYQSVAKRNGSTNLRKKEAALRAMFPETENKMNSREEKDYIEYKSSLTVEHRESLESTDNFLQQVFALQYMPSTNRITDNTPNGTVAYFNAKVKKMVKNKMAEEQVGPLTVQWVKFCYLPKFVGIMINQSRMWHRVVIGSSRPEETEAPIALRTSVPVAYPQGSHDQCLYLCMASALHYIGLEEEASRLARFAPMSESLPGNEAIRRLTQHMFDIAPSIGVGVKFNSSRKRKKKELTFYNLTEEPTIYPTLVIPLAKDGSVSHALCVVDDLIFDSTQRWALKCTEPSFSWVCNCGEKGYASINLAVRFNQNHKTKPLVRKGQKNWILKKKV
jgi:hypothetical protein